MAALHPGRHHRRGSAYIVVLGAAMVVTSIGISALLVNRVRHRSIGDSSSIIKARYYAQGGIDRALFAIEQDLNWRQTYTSGAWFTDITVGDGTFTVEGVDPVDGNLADSDIDDVVLTATGVEGRAQHEMQVTIQAQVIALNCLNVAMTAENDIDFKDGSDFQCDQTIASNNSVVASSATVDAKVEASNVVSGGTYLGITTSGTPLRQMPTSSVFNYYVANGTAINVNNLPVTGSGDPKLSRIVLSPNSNPYGPTNPQGIYKIDCFGQALKIRRCRIVGTIVLLNPSSETQVHINNYWQPAVPNYPALLAEDKIEISMNTSVLDESVEGVNYNPPGTPYQGNADTDQVDIYPSLIKGLIYVESDLEFEINETHIEGVVVSGTGKILLMDGAILDLTYDPSIRENPPPGFRSPPVMKITPGSWRQLVN